MGLLQEGSLQLKPGASREAATDEACGNAFVSASSLVYILWYLFKSRFSDGHFERTDVFAFRVHSFSRSLLSSCFVPGMVQRA